MHSSIKAVDYGENLISTSVQVKVQRLNWTIAGAGAEGFAPFTVRKYFPDTAYWNANIYTINGIAKVEIPIPDTLTTWR
ncbi:MAG: hypothetical protein ACE5J3_12780, partial [Methanosarcinales archaeon]